MSQLREYEKIIFYVNPLQKRSLCEENLFSEIMETNEIMYDELLDIKPSIPEGNQMKKTNEELSPVDKGSPEYEFVSRRFNNANELYIKKKYSPQ